MIKAFGRQNRSYDPTSNSIAVGMKTNVQHGIAIVCPAIL